jgi:hypothetical protein
MLLGVTQPFQGGEILRIKSQFEFPPLQKVIFIWSIHAGNLLFVSRPVADCRNRLDPLLGYVISF